MKHRDLNALLAIGAAFAVTSCATNDSPPCRRVSAQEFMRPHTFKGIATVQFVGFNHSRDRKPNKAFKTIWEMGLFHGWAVIWCPVEELPGDYLATAREKPNRKLPGP